MHLLLAVLLRWPAILMFHQVDVHEPPNALGRALTIRPAQLRAELEDVYAHHLRAVSAQDFIRARNANEPTSDMVILTFDDGYEDQYTQAFPILLEYGAHATFFITTGNVGTFNHVTWPQVRTMLRSGMEIGGHNVHHVDLASLTRSQQLAEITGCLRSLKLHAGVAADEYAYPGGTFNATTEAILEREPILFAFTTDPSRRLGIDSRLEIARMRVLPNVPLPLASPPH